MEPVELGVQTTAVETVDRTRQSDDLWQRVRNGFAMPELNDPLSRQWTAWYAARPTALNRVIEQSRPFLHHVVEAIEARGLPTELALLPIVESAYNPLALSRAKAAGLWQFIPSTGSNFGLRQDWWIDERRDVDAATDAALDYLQYLYEMQGDWHLALASYNWGEGAVQRAVSKQEAAGEAGDYLALKMPKETRHYVPKLQALKNIIRQPELFGITLHTVPNAPYFETLDIPGNIDIRHAARLAEMPIEAFVALNPAFNRPLIPGEAMLQLRLPRDRIDVFRRNLAMNEHPINAWEAHTLKPGETLDVLARRFGIDEALLRSVNGLPRKGDIAPGQLLLLPSGEGFDPSQFGQVAEALPRLRPTVSVHVVRSGETLGHIARIYGVSIRSIMRMNGLRNSRLRIGQRLRMTDKQARGIATANPSRSGRYTVRSGDTLFGVARRHSVRIDELKSWNNLTSSALKPGMVLVIKAP